ncbi:hypothetical protein EG68_07402 [Paragonimus skrjabini miyazakii]|uniref:Uncharacterized protein n=1 Tax=Paragonimus skrjabini miyazakii TaxID=59628 RepID=A0A8S9YXW5_9TREM|nr:hypothetical protein EG68_07402 [Paragonimus skrjabini miyazakii]
MNFDCPFRTYNVTSGRRIVVICSLRDPRVLQRIYYWNHLDASYLCDTFSKDAKIAGSCITGVRKQELVLVVCSDGLDCDIRIKKGGVAIIYSDVMSCYHQSKRDLQECQITHN